MPDDRFDQFPIFQDLSPAQRERLGLIFLPCDYCSGEALFEQGSMAEYLYLVVSGEVIVRYKPEDGEAINVSRIRPGGLVGWSAALGSPAYTSGAVCTGDTQLLRVSSMDLRQLCVADPCLGLIVLERLSGAVAERLQNTREQVMVLLEQGLRLAVPSPAESPGESYRPAATLDKLRR